MGVKWTKQRSANFSLHWMLRVMRLTRLTIQRQLRPYGLISVFGVSITYLLKECQREAVVQEGLPHYTNWLTFWLMTLRTVLKVLLPERHWYLTELIGEREMLVLMRASYIHTLQLISILHKVLLIADT